MHTLGIGGGFGFDADFGEERSRGTILERVLGDDKSDAAVTATAHGSMIKRVACHDVHKDGLTNLFLCRQMCWRR